MASNTDSFNRANGAIGANWVTVGSNPWTIFSNTARPTGGSAESISRYNATYGNDQYSEVVIAVTPTAGNNSAGLLLRCTDSSNFYYTYMPAGKFEIWKKVSGSFSSVHTGNTTTVTVGDTIKFQAVGTAIKLYRNSTEILSATDSSLSSGFLGLIGYAADESGCGFDSWQGGDVGAPSAPQVFMPLSSFIVQ